MRDLDELAELMIERFDQLEAKMAKGFQEHKDALDRIGGHFAIQLDQLEERIVRVASDTAALADAFIPKEENERRLRNLDRARVVLERARDELRGRSEDLENRLYVVQEELAKRGNGNGQGE